ncbi:hypothetical protein MRB53_039988 [Persea americana]|nr:hypothetical protein MRB53_039988 [Persea americana]
MSRPTIERNENGTETSGVPIVIDNHIAFSLTMGLFCFNFGYQCTIRRVRIFQESLMMMGRSSVHTTIVQSREEAGCSTLSSPKVSLRVQGFMHDDEVF